MSLSQRSIRTLHLKHLIVASTQPAPVPTTTPLLESLRAEKTAQKDKEAIQRNHAHYKDPTVVSGVPAVSTDGPSRKDDKKKKGPSIPLPTKPAEAPISKKASKRAAAKAAQQEVAKSTGGSGASNKAAQQASTAQSPSKSAPSSPNPKASRGHRERQASKSIPPPALVPTNPTETTANASSTSQVPTTAAAQPAPRRTRPVLGLGRQFEAALNGAGVAISPAERKARRERQREVSGSGAPGSEKSKVKEDARPANPVTRPSTSQAPPTILQRDPQAQPPQILSRPTPATDTATSAVPSQREDAPV